MSKQKNTVQVTIDGRKVMAKEGQTILEVARDNSIDIPSLCYHPGLESFGACRLCVVEITKESWEGWKKLVTSCLFPVEEGLIVETRSDEVISNRKVVLKLQLARVPNSDVIQKLASEYDVHDVSFSTREDADNCIMCSICVRVCEEIGACAISTLSRGPDKYVDVPFKEACIGCGACAEACPTNAIPVEESDGIRKIWGEEFEMVACDDCGKQFNTRKFYDFWANKLEGTQGFEGKVTICPDCARKNKAKELVSNRI